MPDQAFLQHLPEIGTDYRADDAKNWWQIARSLLAIKSLHRTRESWSSEAGIFRLQNEPYATYPKVMPGATAVSTQMLFVWV
ncbi:hypothetical protein QE408_000738 [Agrobacterium larrymoorei]|uniref:Uncharacterized protein n=1 Tax=Agrobacterium larrymoorei TaxID=160699 RepID=A0ABU0UFA1_9HYPH|nr:hypothetical protein [Agrobacterium larrymoorei]